ncbi:MAG: hypothetical protein WD645_05355 [Dehalococcoidia bacterium]
MVHARELPKDDRDLRELVRQAREERGLLPQQLAAAAGVAPETVEFIEAHGVAATAAMLAVLDFLSIEDYESAQLSRLSQLIPGGRGEVIVQQLVEGGYKHIESIEAASANQLLGMPWFDLGQFNLLRQGLDLHRRAEEMDDADES